MILKDHNQKGRFMVQLTVLRCFCPIHPNSVLSSSSALSSSLCFFSSFHFSGSCFTNSRSTCTKHILHACLYIPSGTLSPNGGARTTFREGQTKLCYSLQFPEPKEETISLFCSTEFKELGEPCVVAHPKQKGKCSWAIDVPGVCFCDGEIERLHMG